MASPAGPQFLQIIDTTGPQVGATVEYYSLADVAQAVYSDPDLMTSLGATLSGGNASDSKGRFPIHWLDPDLSYKRIIKLSNGSTWRTDNPVQSADTSLATALADYVAKAGSTMTGPLNWTEGAAIASASSVNFDTSTGNFFHITGTTGISTITLTHGLRWVVFDAALTLTHSSNLILPNSLNITTVAGDCALFVGEGSGVTRLLWYRCVDGRPLIESAELMIAIGDETTAITTGTAKVTFRMPYSMTLNALPRASLTTASSSGNPAFDINHAGVSIFSTTLTIDANETTSETAATPAVLSTTALVDNTVMTIDIDTAGTNAAGAKLLLRGYRRNRA